MEKKSITKHDIIKIASQLFTTQGFHYTSMAQIAAACELSKASIYHYVTSKQDIITIALNDLIVHFKENCFHHIYDTSLARQSRFNNVLSSIKKHFCHQQGGCLVGNLSIELCALNDENRKLVKVYFDTWLKAFARIFAEKYEVKESLQLAEDFICQFQGTLLISRLYQREVLLERLFERTRLLIV